jgi:hypothetical protein
MNNSGGFFFYFTLFVGNKFYFLQVSTDLITGDQIIRKEGSSHISCTVEMAQIDKFVDVVVIDEIQMIAHQERGFFFIIFFGNV